MVPFESTGLHRMSTEMTQTRIEILALVKEIQTEFGQGAIHFYE